MLEKVALHQTRFRVPGCAPDARGVLLGERGLVLFSSIDRLVAFLTALAAQGSLEDLLPTIEIRQVTTKLRTQELVLSLEAGTSNRLDRIAAVARLVRGLTFTGTDRHFVKYRDAASPFGYDLDEVLRDAGALVLYHDSFEQSYETTSTISLRDLVMRLTPTPSRRRQIGDRQLGDKETRRVLLSVGSGLTVPLARYLFGARVDASVANVEWPSRSSFDDLGAERTLFEIPRAPARILALFSGVPGVRIYSPVAENLAVELGFEHPLTLQSLRPLFDADALYLFTAKAGVEVVRPRPELVPVTALATTPLRGSGPELVREARAAGRSLDLVMQLEVAPKRVSATPVLAIVPIAERGLLRRILQVLPPRAFQTLRIAITEESILLYDPAGLDALPLGRMHYAIAPRIHVPSGFGLVPSVPADTLDALYGERGDLHLIFAEGEREPRSIADAAFVPLTRELLDLAAPLPLEPDALETTEPTLPWLEYASQPRFPLRGAPRDGGAAPGDDDGRGEGGP